MSPTPETLERELIDDLARLEDRVADAEFCGDLYRALTNARWRREEEPDGWVSLSWSRAEEVVNELRARVRREPMALAQTGGEGEVSDLVAGELDRLGWRFERRHPGSHDEEHLTRPVESPPPRGTGEFHSPADDAGGWKRVGDERAEEGRRERVGPPQRGGLGSKPGRD